MNTQALNRNWLRLTTLLVALIVLVGCTAIVAQPAQPAQPQSMTFEVAEDGTRFVFSQERLFDDGMPQYGTPFVTQGYLYPAGTLNGSNGVLADGSPEFPDKVIGEWTCYGWMIGDGGHTTTGAWVISTQAYQFNEEHAAQYGTGIIITDGFELVDFDVPIARTITAGTGDFVGMTGVQEQTLWGFTEQMGVNLSVTITGSHANMGAPQAKAMKPVPILLERTPANTLPIPAEADTAVNQPMIINPELMDRLASE